MMPAVKITERFVVGMIPDGGARKRGFSAICGHCGCRGSVAMSGGMTDSKEEKIVASKFEARGWKIGTRQEQHRCPGCFSKIKGAAIRKSTESKMTTVTKFEKPPSPVMEVSKELSREDRRIIFEKLNEIYADEKIGYSGDWTDAKAAVDLGVPRSWVASVRDEMFGPEGSNANIRATVREAKELLMEIKKAATPAETIVSNLRIMLGKADKIEKTLVEIERALR